MSQNISNIYIESFDPLSKLAYERRGNQLPSLCRMATNIVGKSHDFPVYGAPSDAASKAQYEEFSTTGKGGTKAFKKATMGTNYWHEWVDPDDMTSTNVDDVQNSAMEAVNTVGKATDSKIVAALATTSNTIAVGTSNLDKPKVLAAQEKLNAASVPMEDRFALVDASQWTALLGIEEFASQDYVGYDDLPWLTAKNSRIWLGITWILYPGLPLSTKDRSCFLFHRQAVGYANAIPLQTSVDWIEDRDAWLIKAKTRDGAVTLDDAGVVEIVCLEP